MNDTTPDGPPPATLAQLETLEIRRGQPLLVVDVDDCIAVYVEHLDRFMTETGFELRLESYELEGSMFRTGSDVPLAFDECIAVLDGFFRRETLHQRLMPDAGAVLHRLSAHAQIVILTNVPAFAGDDRRRNLAAQGVEWPVVTNTGGKGRALAWLAEAAGGPETPTAFVDDSVRQIESVARHAPDVARLHFAGAETVRRLAPDCAAATARALDWREAEGLLRRLLKLDAPVP